MTLNTHLESQSNKLQTTTSLSRVDRNTQLDIAHKWNGEFLGALIAPAEKACRENRVSSVDLGDGRAILHRVARHIGDWNVIATLRNQLADTLFEDGQLREDRNNFWWDLGDIQDALLTGKTRICRNCGEMEGVHHLGALYCRRQRWCEGPHVLSYRFQAQEI